MAGRKKRYVWLKLEREFFRRKEIKKLRRQAGGDTYAVIVLEMALLSLENDGILIFSGLEDDMYDEIALELDEEASNVRVALDYLLKTGWAEILDENTILLTCTVNRIGSESESAGRMRKLREKRKASQCDVDVTPELRDGVTSDTEGEGEEEKDIEKETEVDTEGKTADAPAPTDEAVTDICFYFCDAFHVKSVDVGFQNDVQKFLSNGLTVEDIKKTINSAKTRLPKQPIPYVIAALKSLQQLRKPVQLKEEDRPIPEWEQEWAEEFNALKKRMEEN